MKQQPSNVHGLPSIKESLRDIAESLGELVAIGKVLAADIASRPLDVNQVKRAIGVSRKTVLAMVKDGRLPEPVSKTGRAHYWDPFEIQEARDRLKRDTERKRRKRDRGDGRLRTARRTSNMDVGTQNSVKRGSLA